MRYITVSLLATMFTLSSQAQELRSIAKGDFEKINLDGAFIVDLVEVGTDVDAGVSIPSESPKSADLKVEINGEGVISVSEKIDKNRSDSTRLTIAYHKLSSIEVSAARVNMTTTLNEKIVDLKMQSAARLSGSVDIDDIQITSSGDCVTKLDGEARYIKIDASRSALHCGDLVVMSADIEASQSAEVEIEVYDRLVAKSTSNANILYGGRPKITRLINGFKSGKIEPKR